MSPHDSRSNFQDSGGLQLEMRCRMPSLDSVSRLGCGVAAASVRPERRLYLLISEISTLLFCPIGPEPTHNERPGLALLQSLPGRPGSINYRPLDSASIIFPLKSGNLRGGVGRIGFPVTERFNPVSGSATIKRLTIPILSL